MKIFKPCVILVLVIGGAMVVEGCVEMAINSVTLLQLFCNSKYKLNIINLYFLDDEQNTLGTYSLLGGATINQGSSHYFRAMMPDRVVFAA
jgi:hypothetical protein